MPHEFDPVLDVEFETLERVTINRGNSFPSKLRKFIGLLSFIQAYP